MTGVGFRRNPEGAARIRTQTPYIGAIRWDAWFGPSEFNTAGTAVETSLGPDDWRTRLPFFGTEVNATTVTARGNTQETVDAEIGYARQAGLHYWAFVAYHPPDHPDLDHLTYGLKLYRQSTVKDGLRYCLIIQQMGEAANWETVTLPLWAEMAAEPDYMTVLGGRPLVYLFGAEFADSTDASAADITALRAAFTDAGTGDPYIAIMSGSPSSAATLATTLGADAISGYTWQASNAGSLEERTYASLVATNLSQRVAALATGKKVIPCVNEGWDKRPRYDNPPPWEPGLEPNVWYARATAAEFSNNVRDVVDWVRLNRTACDSEAIIIYAWNEIDEGGWMTPPNASFGSEGTTRLDGLKTALLNRRIAV